MEVGEGVNDGAEFGLLGARLKDFFVELGVGAQQVGLHTLWGLVGELDASLKEEGE